MSRGSRRNDNGLKYYYIKDPNKYNDPEKKNMNPNKMARNNFIKVFIFLFVIMMFFLIYSRIANGASDIFLNAYPLSPDTDTKVRLEWSSVPGARIYRIFRNAGSGESLIATIDTENVLDPLKYVDSGLNPDTQYIYTIRAYSDEAGTQLLQTPHNEAFVRTTALIRPYGLQAVYNINSRKATLTWNHSALADGSIICRYENGQLVYEREVPETGSAEESVYEPDTVIFTVKTKATSAGYGVSQASDPITVVPVSAPSITAEYINQSTVRITWDDSKYINLFQLEASRWDETASKWGDWTVISLSPSGTGTTSTVTIGGKYRYRLNAKSGSGYTGVSSITEYISNLAAPSNLTANIVSNGRIDLSWTNAAGNEGSLQVWRKDGGDKDSGTYKLLATLTNNTNTFTDLFTLVSGTTYHYRVNAVNTSGNYSAYAYTGITAAVPAAPVSLRASITTADGITLEWTDNSNNESGFRIERFDETSKAFAEIATVATNTATYKDTAVVAGESYIYRIRAFNIMGNSPYSNEIVVNAWDTSAPTFLHVDPVSSSRLDLSWNYSGTVNYNTIIERKIGVEGKWEPIYTTAAGVVKYSDTGLKPNTRYFYRVRKSLGSGAAGIPYPNNEIGEGAYTLLGDIYLSGAAHSNNSIQLSWSGNNERADIIVERRMADGNFKPISTVGPEANHWTDTTGLVPGASYTYRVMARTVNNRSLYSNEITVRNYFLEAPSDLTISVEADQSVILNWKDNSSDETGFEIWRYVFGKSTYSLYAVVGQNATSFRDVNVEKGAQYMYMVRAYVTSGGLYSSYSNAVSMGVGMVSPPVDLSYKYISGTQIQLEWVDTANNEDGFKIERKIGVDGAWTVVYWVPKDQKTYGITGLNPYTTYYFRVRAYNSSLNADSVSEEIMVSVALPQKPTNLTAVALSSNQVKLTWKDNSDNEDTFRILRSSSANGTYVTIAEVGRNTVTYLDNTVQPSMNYYYKVEAVNSIGSSGTSAEASARTTARVRFTDTSGVPWAEEAIENMAGMGILKGVTDTLFKPGNVITRAEFTSMVVRAFKLDTAPVGSMADVKSNKWYYREVMIAENLGVISGDADNKFYPESPITREDISLILFKALMVSGRKYSLHDNSVLEKFVDKDQISPHAVSSMAALVGEGIIEGLQGNAIGPKYAATRAQAAVFVYRALTKSEPMDEQ